MQYKETTNVLTYSVAANNMMYGTIILSDAAIMVKIITLDGNIIDVCVRLLTTGVYKEVNWIGRVSL